MKSVARSLMAVGKTDIGTFLRFKFYCVHEKVMWFVVFGDSNKQ